MGVVVEVVIGLTLTYLLVSLICTVLNEFVASTMKLRARSLRTGIVSIIDESGLRDALLNSGIFRMAGRASGSVGPSYLPASTFALALLDALDPNRSAESARTTEEIAAAIDKLPPSEVKATLSALVRNAGTEVDTVRVVIADWFDEMMERLGGVYKRNMQMLSLAFAVVLCVALNVDSVQIAQALWYDDNLRTSIAESASELTLNTDNVDDLADLAVISEDLRPLPIGWDFVSPGWSGDWFRSFHGWVLKIVGLAFSALAVSLGAPFWFDVLNKFVRIRGAGKEPKTEQPAATGPAVGKGA